MARERSITECRFILHCHWSMQNYVEYTAVFNHTFIYTWHSTHVYHSCCPKPRSTKMSACECFWTWYRFSGFRPSIKVSKSVSNSSVALAAKSPSPVEVVPSVLMFFPRPPPRITIYQSWVHLWSCNINWSTQTAANLRKLESRRPEMPWDTRIVHP